MSVSVEWHRHAPAAPGTGTPPGLRGLRVAIVVLVTATGAAGQAVQGRVVVAGTGDPIPGAELTLSDTAGVVARTLSDSTGAYELRPPGPGFFTYRATGLGYETMSGAVWVPAVDPLLADVELRVVPIPLGAIEVAVQARVPHLEVTGFYQRLAEGHGYFIVREQIERRSARYVTDLLRNVPGARVVRTDNVGLYDVIMRGGASREFAGFPGARRGGRPRTQLCLPSITIDGTMVRRGGRGYEREGGRWNELVQPAEIEAIEVYSGAAGLPPQGARVKPRGRRRAPSSAHCFAIR